ncbi:hypothetical protein [Fluviispira sanaruensis]|uniref:Uncharacterized protein n=1 Tax=Fluviispira sanaruensis TaxID=2493639 RepID=A0A4P2VHZ6_FLUSA|nr:hypothetical protein [Fluviispira sanaruensis]BBH52606.1 hypothetical protein JCM31447_10470 [Fluviispira sanaruensis]
MLQSQRNDPEPWYVRKKKANTAQQTSRVQKNTPENIIDKAIHVKQGVSLVAPFFFSLLFAVAAGVFFSYCFLSESHGLKLFIYAGGGVLSLIFSIFFLFYKIGAICSYLSPKNEDMNLVALGIKYFQGNVHPEEPRKGIPAPEMALYQFIQQVRAYAMEKSFLKQKQERTPDPFSSISGADPNSLLKRRWNDVVDSLNEFEIYLANDPKGIIEKLIVKSPPQNMDVSQIFRDVAETFDTTWRRKGINIEQAIVTPLKASTNEAVLRRLLVGPWRSSVYFARRGNGVVFSAKSVDGKISARWECEGMAFPEEFFDLMRNSELSVNERIEQGMLLIAPDPNSPNTLFALISFVTWIDLATAAGCDYVIKQGTEGMVIELRL